MGLLIQKRRKKVSLVNYTASYIHSGADPYTVAFNVGTGPGRFLLIATRTYDVVASSVTYGGVPLTLYYDAYPQRLWTLNNPPSGTNNVVVDYSGYGKNFLTFAVFGNVDNTDPIALLRYASGTSTTPAIGPIRLERGGIIYADLSDAYDPGYAPTINVGTSLGSVRDSGGGVGKGAAYNNRQGFVSWTANSHPWQVIAVGLRPRSTSPRLIFSGEVAATGITGALTGTLADATLAATGTVAIAGTASVTLDAATSTATGTLAIVGTASPTLDAATLAATGALAISGAASITLDTATLAATGNAGVTGTADVTLDAATVAATGTLAIAGAASPTLADATAAGTGALAIAGTLTGTLADASLAATGVIGTITTGALDATLEAATVAATGALAIAGTAAPTLADATAAATGTVALAGAATVTLDAATVVAAGNITISGALAQTLADATLAATGAAGAVRTGVLAVTLADVTMAARLYPSAVGPIGSMGPLHRPTEARRAKQAAERRPPNRR